MKRHIAHKEVLAKRREQAEERDIAWRALTPQEQLASLDKRGLKAERQRKRIVEKLNVKS